jgi:hypothetical protein
MGENKNTRKLSDRALENLKRNAEIRLSRNIKSIRLLVLHDGGEFIRVFDPEQIEPKEIDYEGNGEKKQKFDYIVRDPNTDEVETFRANIKNSGDIDALLAEGYRLLKVRREGSGKRTRYYVTPVNESRDIP